MTIAIRPTIRDVAELASVSLSTVSVVLNGTGPSSVEMRRRVLEAVEQLGYEPNFHARNMKRQRSQAIGLIVPDLLNPFFALVAEGVESEAASRDHVVVLCLGDASTEREALMTRALRSRRLDGVIHLSGTGVAPPSLRELVANAPVVFVDERIPGFKGPFVGADNRDGARRAAELVLSHGHRRLGVVAGPNGLWTAEERLRGYREALAEAGIDPRAVDVVTGDYRIDSGRAAAGTMLDPKRTNPPTAILAANDLMAVGCLQHCVAAGLDVPGDVSIVGFDDVPLASIVTPGLTTVRQPAREMGAAAARVLLDLIDHGVEREPAMLSLPVETVVRGSLGSPR